MSRSLLLFQLLTIVALTVTISARAVWSANAAISQLADRADSEIGALDILEATVRPVGADSLQLELRVREPVPIDQGPRVGITYLWFLDTDGNAETGQPHGPVGSEYNVRVAYTGSWDGFVDAILPGSGFPGEPTVFVHENTVFIRVPRLQVGGVTRFAWSCEAFATNGGQRLPGDRTEGFAVASLPEGPGDQNPDLAVWGGVPVRFSHGRVET